MRNYIVKVTKQVTEWWTVESDNEIEVSIIYETSGHKILQKTENETMEIKENENIKDGWDVLSN